MKTKLRDTRYCGVSRKTIESAYPTFYPEMLVRFHHFITERYTIHLRKDILQQPPPWTKDRILRAYRFTNIFREDDRVSRALIDQVSSNNDLTLEEKILNTFLFRSWNNPRTFQDFGGPWSAEEIYDGLTLKEKVRPLYRELSKAEPDRKWWTSAYNQGGTKRVWGCPGIDGSGDRELDIPLRVFHIGPWLLQENTVSRLLEATYQSQAYEIIQQQRGFANFMAYQIFVDLTYIKDFPFSENEFVVAGPGCKWGLDMLFSDLDWMSYEEALFWLRDNINDLFQELYKGHKIKEPWLPNTFFIDRKSYDRHLNVMSLENCFCEFSKYIRAYRNVGRPRCRYRPGQSPYVKKGDK